MIKNLQARLRGFATGLGVAGMIGIGLMVFGAALYASSVVPARDELKRLETRVARAARGSPATGIHTAASSTEQIERFQRQFPAFSEMPELVVKLHTIAKANGIVLATGEYRLATEPGWNLARYQITLPLTGSYPQVRLFLAQLLDEVPALSLDEISIKRDSISAATAETRVRLTAYLVD